MYVVSIQSFGIILLTGAFAGLAVALQAYIGFSRVHAEQFTGLVATLGIVRELGPVLTGIIVSAKTGSSIAAELGTMKITEQIDALRILATTIMLPFLTIFAMIFGISSSYILCVVTLSINEQAYISIIQEYLKLNDIVGGLIKALVFGFIISLMGTYMGYKTEGGARGVGIATTAAVVSGSILILIGNYILSSFLYNTGIS
jgi:phospholipid/cholesterol/gamma-HCH transport system permease protein